MFLFQRGPHHDLYTIQLAFLKLYDRDMVKRSSRAELSYRYKVPINRDMEGKKKISDIIRKVAENEKVAQALQNWPPSDDETVGSVAVNAQERS